MLATFLTAATLIEREFRAVRSIPISAPGNESTSHETSLARKPCPSYYFASRRCHQHIYLPYCAAQSKVFISVPCAQRRGETYLYHLHRLLETPRGTYLTEPDVAPDRHFQIVVDSRESQGLHRRVTLNPDKISTFSGVEHGLPNTTTRQSSSQSPIYRSVQEL